MRVRLLGGLQVEGITERDLGSRKGRTLLKALAAARATPVSLDRLAEIVWADNQPAQPAVQLGVLVSRLRGVLGADRIPKTDVGYALHTDWLDIDELDSLSATASAALSEGRVGAARAATQAATVLIRGPLLPDEDGVWIEAERARVGAAVSRVRRLAVEAAVAAGDYDAASTLADLAMANDPYDEALLRALMDAHLRAGRPASALAAYARMRHRLAEDLGVPPSSPTEELHARALAAADGDLVTSRPVPASIGIVGRQSELGALDAALATAADGGVALVLVEGDAGIGKTTLVESWSRHIADAVVLRGRCDELGRDLPLQPVIDALADHLRMQDPVRRSNLLADDGAPLAPLLGPIAGPTATVVTDAQAAQARVFAAIATVLNRLDPALTAVLVIEDLHLADAATVNCLNFVRRRGQRTLIVATSRPGGGRQLNTDHRLVLGPLDLDAVTELVGRDRAELLFQRSAGHPLLLAALHEAPADELPQTLADAVAARVDSLGTDVASTLRVAAVLGHECDLDVISRLLDVAIVDVIGRLETAANVGLVAERGDRFVFRHELVREALTAATGVARRALIHREAARVLAGRADPDPLAVAVHARAGGDLPLASSALVTAALAAASRFDLETAEEHLAGAIELHPTPEAFTARARVRMGGQNLEGAAVDAKQAISLGGGAPALEIAGWIAYYQRRYDDARAMADEAAARATDDEALRVSALALGGRIRHASGDLRGAVAWLTSVEGGPPNVRGVADVWLAQVRNHQGQPRDALAALAGPMVDPDSLAHPWAPLHLRFNRALALGQLGRVADALRTADDLEQQVAKEGVVGKRFQAPTANVTAWVLRWTGRGEEADERNLEAVEMTGGRDGPSAESFAEGHHVALLDLADGCVQRRDWTEAAVLADRLEVLDTWNGTMAWHQRHRLGLLRARLALADGDGDRATGLAVAVADDASSRGAGRYELLGRGVAGLADPSIANESLDAVVSGLERCAVLDGWPLIAALAEARQVPAWRAEAERLAGIVVANAGEHVHAARRLVTAVLR